MSNNTNDQSAISGNKFDYQYFSAIPFILLHLTCFAVFWTGFTTTSVILCISFYLLRMWAVTGGYHRYFSHRSYETSRWFQFVIAFLAQTSAQQGAVWWANHHRLHHKYSDMPEDVHSPRQHGFFYSHVGWVFTPEHSRKDYEMVKDWQRYPELMWLDKHKYFPAFVLAIIAWLIGGWPGLIVGFFISTVFVYHCTFFINSLAHVVGTQRYITADDSRNNWWLALITLGEGWHNNHHFYSTSARQGFRWYEIDITYYVLKGLEKCGLIWNLEQPPQEILSGTARVPQKIADRARELVNAASLNLEGISTKIIEMAKTLSHVIDQPTAQVSKVVKDFRVNLEQLGDSLRERTKHLEQLPPILKAVFREKFKQATQALETAIRSLELRQHWQQVIDALYSAAHSLEFAEINQK